MGSRSGPFFIGSKQEKDKDECDVGLGLRMQDQPHYKALVGGTSHRNHEPSPLLSSGGGDGGGSVFCGISNRVACSGDIYDVVGAAASASASASASGSGDEVALSRTAFYHLIPDSSSSSSSSSSSFAFNLSGEMTPSMNVAGFPFTAAQWQELERQTLIFKYMMASVPVPPELLVSITRSQSTVVPSSQSNMVRSSSEMGTSSNSSDSEPWRCKRTDGKKWRCSRDVVPDQKYCERHSHKSRHRSRKPVELHTDSMSNTISYTTNTGLPNQKSQFSTWTNCSLSMSLSAMASAATSSYDQPRSLEWLLKDETVPVARNSGKEWNYKKGDSFQQHYGEDSNLYMHLGRGQTMQPQPLIDRCSLLSSATTSKAQETRHFLDVWSSTGLREKSVSGAGKECCSSVSSSGEKLLPLSSSHTLSMRGDGEGGETDQESENAQVGNFGVMSHGSWMGSPPGGPLAEALCFGISGCRKADSDLSSPRSS